MYIHCSDKYITLEKFHTTMFSGFYLMLNYSDFALKLIIFYSF